MLNDLLEFNFVDTGEVTLHVATAGDKTKPLIILLHGFPEFYYGWKEQISDLVDAGYYLVIPDQRGYNKSDKPSKISDYSVDKLAEDVIALVKWTGHDQAYLAGHDWGAAVAWYTAAIYPQFITKLIVINVPHSKVFAHHLRNNPVQKKKSRYMIFFQIPFIPQFYMSLFNFRSLRKSLLNSSLPNTFTDEDMEHYTAAWSEKRALPCMLNWYRAAFRHSDHINYTEIEIPVLIIWGKMDKFLNYEMAKDSLQYCSDGKLEVIEDATHWVLKERSVRVNKLIIDYFGQ